MVRSDSCVFSVQWKSTAEWIHVSSMSRIFYLRIDPRELFVLPLGGIAYDTQARWCCSLHHILLECRHAPRHRLHAARGIYCMRGALRGRTTSVYNYVYTLLVFELVTTKCNILFQAHSDTQGDQICMRMPKGFEPIASAHCLTLNHCIFRLCQLNQAFIMSVREIREQQDNRSSLSHYQRTSLNMGILAQCIMFFLINVFLLLALFFVFFFVVLPLHSSRAHYIRNGYWLMIAFITCNSNLVPLLEGLCSSNPCRFEFSVLSCRFEFCRKRNRWW